LYSLTDQSSNLSVASISSLLLPIKKLLQKTSNADIANITEEDMDCINANISLSLSQDISHIPLQDRTVSALIK